MWAKTRTISPVEEAERARQVVAVLTRIEERFEEGHWRWGRRFAPGGNCLVGAIDEASDWMMPGVGHEVTVQLARRLPHGLRVVARTRPRLALATYNDLTGCRAVLRLVGRTRAELGGLPRRRPLTTYVATKVPSRW
jgi:hypothetical protein